MTTLTLVRGVPGSGKSTFARLQRHSEVFEADDFFVDLEGEYNWDYRFLQYAHERCLGAAAYHLRGGNNVTVANCFTKYWELKRYLELAELVGAKVEIVHCVGNYGNLHGVPAEKVEEMRSRFQTNSALEKLIHKDFPDVKVVFSTYDRVHSFAPEVSGSEAQ